MSNTGKILAGTYTGKSTAVQRRGRYGRGWGYLMQTLSRRSLAGDRSSLARTQESRRRHSIPHVSKGTEAGHSSEGSGKPHQTLYLWVWAPSRQSLSHPIFTPGAHQGADLGLPPLLCPQSPAVIDSPLKLELRVLAPPRCTIKPSGSTVSVTASVTIALVPPDQPEVQLSSMTMVRALERGY